MSQKFDDVVKFIMQGENAFKIKVLKLCYNHH